MPCWCHWMWIVIDFVSLQGCSHRCDNQNHGWILTELLRYCKHTTIKGVARTVKPGHRRLRYTWVVAVLALLFMSVYHVTELIEAFLEYGTTVYYNEQVVDILRDPGNAIIPEITVCNIQPLSFRAINNSGGILSYPDYLDILTSKFHCPTCNTAFPQDLESQLRKFHGYFQFIGVDAAKVVGHSLEDIILEYNVISSEAATWKMLPCEGLARISLTQFSDTFNCYLFTLITRSQDILITGVSLVLYAGSPSLNNLWWPADPTLSSKGILLAIHPPSSLPFMGIQADGLSTGMFYTIPVSVVRNEKLSDPYGECVEPHQSNYTHGSYVGYLRYTPMTCWSACVEEAVTTNCNCQDGNLAGVIAAFSHLPYCADAKATVDVLTTRMRCAESYRNIHTASCYSSCPVSCSEITYNSRLSHFNWPDKAVASTFYDQYVHGRPIENIFGNITQLSDGECEVFNPSCARYDDIVKRLQNNFLGFQIYLSDFKAFIIGTQSKMGAPQLFSQIGGVLNLWSGISIIALVELFELVINLVIARRHKNSSVNSEQDSSPQKWCLNYVENKHVFSHLQWSSYHTCFVDSDLQ